MNSLFFKCVKLEHTQVTLDNLIVVNFNAVIHNRGLICRGIGLANLSHIFSHRVGNSFSFYDRSTTLQCNELAFDIINIAVIIQRSEHPLRVVYK